jgi:hypothetical protein
MCQFRYVYPLPKPKCACEDQHCKNDKKESSIPIRGRQCHVRKLARAADLSSSGHRLHIPAMNLVRDNV